MNISFKALGGGNEIGANCYLLTLGNTNLVLDCGLHPRKKGAEMFPDLDLIKDMDINDLIITHAHTDHISSLPYFLKFFPHINIHCTAATLSAMEVMLVNTSHLLKKEYEESFDKDLIENYSEEVLNMIPMIVKRYDYNEKIILSEDLSFKFLNAGHIIGSASVLIEAGNKKLFYTGDINLRDQSLIPMAVLPRHKVDILITESTNCGVDDYPDYETETERLAKFINDIINANGSVLIPAFAMGKSQEMLTRISSLIENNKIPRVPIYYSFMSGKVDQVYDRYNYTVDRIEKGFKLGKIEVIPLERSDTKRGDFYNEPSILILTSGMIMERTASYKIAKRFLPLDNFGIAVCGYCDPETPGFQIRSAKKNDIIFLNSLEDGILVKCKIGNFRFSAHARKKEIMEMIDKLDPETVIIVHGDEPAVSNLGNYILNKNKNTRVISPEKGKSYELIP